MRARRLAWAAAMLLLAAMALLPWAGAGLLAQSVETRAVVLIYDGATLLHQQCYGFPSSTAPTINAVVVLSTVALNASPPFLVVAELTVEGGVVCRIDGLGCGDDADGDGCSDDSPCGAGGYLWQYRVWDAGAEEWIVPTDGLAVGPGDVTAWVWGDGTTSLPPPDDLIFETLCPTRTPTPTASLTATATRTATATSSPTATLTPSHTPTATHTWTPTHTPTHTDTPTRTPTVTRTRTMTRTPTMTRTATRTRTATPDWWDDYPSSDDDVTDSAYPATGATDSVYPGATGTRTPTHNPLTPTATRTPTPRGTASAAGEAARISGAEPGADVAAAGDLPGEAGAGQPAADMGESASEGAPRPGANAGGDRPVGAPDTASLRLGQEPEGREALEHSAALIATAVAGTQPEAESAMAEGRPSRRYGLFVVMALSLMGMIGYAVLLRRQRKAG